MALNYRSLEVTKQSRISVLPSNEHVLSLLDSLLAGPILSPPSLRLSRDSKLSASGSAPPSHETSVVAATPIDLRDQERISLNLFTNLFTEVQLNIAKEVLDKLPVEGEVVL